MIRLNKPVKLLEWGEGTNTVNQVWKPMAHGALVSARSGNGATVLVVEVKGPVSKTNTQDESIKVTQEGEGMTARSAAWGEVACGRLKCVENVGQKCLVYVEIPTATKISRSSFNGTNR
ncbi:MAG: hypothetical protein HY711_03455 [Candidatus Melainabacteria bacterium]|nr:hypothetical protein [Candidatus Melainabacteria bacterium]